VNAPNEVAANETAVGARFSEGAHRLPPGWRAVTTVTLVPILELDDARFQRRWRGMSDEERSVLPPEIRGQGFRRYRKLTDYVDATIHRMNREQKRIKAPDVALWIDGAALLEDVHAFLGRFVSYPQPEAHVAHTLWVAHAHAMAAWESTPRIAFLSPEPGSGKTRALEVTETLVPRPVEAINATPAYLFRKVSDPAGSPTLLYDEIDTLFGPRAKEHEEVRAILNAGHRRGAMAGRCVVRGKTIETEELPAYCAVALAGLGDLPDTILTRSIVVRMRRRAPDEFITPYRTREHAGEGNELRDRLKAWVDRAGERLRHAPLIPPSVTDRNADVWEPLLAIADAAGGEWPERARVSAVTFVTLASVATPSLGIRLLADLRDVFGEREAMATNTMLDALVALDEAPWGDLKGKPLDARRLANFLRRYGVESKTVRIGDKTYKGYAREELHDPWLRYVGQPTDTAVTSVTTGTACPRCAGEGCRWCQR